MDASDLALHGGSNAISVALGWGVSKLLGFRAREREEDAATARAKSFDELRDRVTRLEERADHHADKLDELLSELKDLRRDVRDALEGLRR